MGKLLISFIFILLWVFASTNVFAWYVNGYYRSNGTYVNWYYRSDSNSSYSTPTYTTPTYVAPTYTYTTPVSCSTTFWYGSQESWDWKCSCRVWYEWWTMLWKDYCVTKTCYKYGLNVTLNYSTNACECNSWYTAVTSSYWTQSCEKKAYSSYAILQEYKDGYAIVSYKNPSWYTKRSKITIYSCPSASLYVWKTVVVNLMRDETLNYWDYLVLADDLVCNISYSDNYISDDETMYTCSDIYWDNSIDTTAWKCGCKKGYVWATDWKSCTTKNIPVIPVCLDTINSTLNADWNCYCNSGYIWSNTSNSCIINPVITTKIVCKKGQLKRGNKCVDIKTLKQ